MADSITARVLFNVVKFSLLIISLILLGFSWFFNKDNLEQDAWPVTKGKVFYSQAVEVRDTFLGRNTKHFDLDIKYGYVVDKKSYYKKGLFLDGADKTLEKSYYIEKAKEYKKGDMVKVHYNPVNPQQSYLVADIDSGTRAFYSASKKLLAFTIFLFLITPLLTFFKDKLFIKKNKVESGLVIPDDVKRVNPIKSHR